MDYQILCFSVIINLLIINSHAVGMDSWVLTAAKSIFRESIFLDQLYTFSLLSLNSFLQPFSEKFLDTKIISLKILTWTLWNKFYLRRNS